MSMQYQSMIKQPRDSIEDPRIAKIDTTILSRGKDGILYKMLEPKNWEKFQILNEKEMKNEINKSKEIKENMYTLSGKLKNGTYSSYVGSKTRFVSPMFGTISKDKKIDKKKWENDLNAIEHGTKSQDQLSDTMKKLVNNSVHVNEPIQIVPTNEIKTEFQPVTGGLGITQRTEDRLHQANNTLKHKFEQNLHVVEALYDEKKVMEHKIQQLEHRLGKITYGPDDNSIGDWLPSGYEDGYEDLRPPSYNELKQSDYEPRPTSNDDFYSASDLAMMLNSKDSNEPLMKEKKDHVNYSTDDIMLRSKNSIHQSFENSRRPSSAGAIYAQISSQEFRSRRMKGASSHLQADADRYVQKRRLLDEQERVKKLEQQQWELNIKEKTLRASVGGKEFADMKKRQDYAEEAKQMRLDKEKRNQELLEMRQKKERFDRREANKQSMTMVTKNQLSWKELQEIEEAKRRDRIERRKQELAQSSALPSSIAENLQKGKRSITPHNEIKSTFKAEDPEKVSAKLALQQKVWDLKLAREREKRRDKEASRLLTNSTPRGSFNSGTGEIDIFKSKMEVRNEKYELRKRQKERERHEKEEETQKRLKEIFDRKQRLLEEVQVPEGKPTRSTIFKAEKVRADMMKAQREENKARMLMRKKSLAEKETSAVLRVVISERKSHLNTTNGYMELNPYQRNAKAAELAASKREESRNIQRAMKERINNALAKRKSLMERHDEKIAIKNASNFALFKIANVVNENKTYNNELFDAKEQIILGYRSI